MEGVSHDGCWKMHLRHGRVVVSGVRSLGSIDVGWFVSALSGEDPISQHLCQSAVGFPSVSGMRPYYLCCFCSLLAFIPFPFPCALPFSFPLGVLP